MEARRNYQIFQITKLGEEGKAESNDVAARHAAHAGIPKESASDLSGTSRGCYYFSTKFWRCSQSAGQKHHAVPVYLEVRDVNRAQMNL